MGDGKESVGKCGKERESDGEQGHAAKK